MRNNRKLTLVASLLFMAWATNPSLAQTVRSDDFSLVYRTLDGDTTDFEEVGAIEATRTLDDLDLYGIGYTVHNSEYVAFNVNMLFGNVDLTEMIDGTPEEFNTDLFAADFNINYYLLDEFITPMLTGGVGVMSFFGDYSETNFTFNAGAGLRAEITNDLTFEALYHTTWLKLEETDDLLALEGYTLSILFKF